MISRMGALSSAVARRPARSKPSRHAARPVGVDRADDELVEPRDVFGPQAPQRGDRLVGLVDPQVDERKSLLVDDQQGGGADLAGFAAGREPGLERAHQALAQMGRWVALE